MKTPCALLLFFLFASLISCSSAEKKLPDGLVDTHSFMRKGDFWLRRGCYEKAERYYKGARQVAERIDSRDSIVHSLNKLAAVCLMANDYAGALGYAQKAVILAGDAIGPELKSAISGNLASIANALGKPDDAEKYWQESLSIARLYNIKSQQLVTLANLARARRLRGDNVASRQALAEATTIMEADNEYKNANVLLQYGLLLKDKGDLKGAQARITEALKLDREQEYTPGLAHDLRWLGELMLNSGNIDEGRANLDRAFYLFLALGNIELIEDILATMKSFPKAFGEDDLKSYASAINASDPKETGAPDLCSF